MSPILSHKGLYYKTMQERLVVDLLYNQQESKYWAIEVLSDENEGVFTLKRHYTIKDNNVVSVEDYVSEDFNNIIDRYENKVVSKLRGGTFKMVRDGDDIGNPPDKLLELLGLSKTVELPPPTTKQYRKIKLHD